MAHRPPENEVDGPSTSLPARGHDDHPQRRMLIHRGAGAGDMRSMRGYSIVMPSLSTASVSVAHSLALKYGGEPRGGGPDGRCGGWPSGRCRRRPVAMTSCPAILPRAVNGVALTSPTATEAH